MSQHTDSDGYAFLYMQKKNLGKSQWCYLKEELFALNKKSWFRESCLNTSITATWVNYSSSGTTSYTLNLKILTFEVNADAFASDLWLFIFMHHWYH